jgi:hypothetical protein
MLADIPETEPRRTRWLDNLQGLVWAGRDQAHRMRRFLHEASDRHRFPKDHDDLECDEVKETPALYLVGR